MRSRVMVSRSVALLTACMLSWGTAMLTATGASAAQLESDSSSCVVGLSYGNLLCKLFPRLGICKDS